MATGRELLTSKLNTEVPYRLFASRDYSAKSDELINEFGNAVNRIKTNKADASNIRRLNDVFWSGAREIVLNRIDEIASSNSDAFTATEKVFLDYGIVDLSLLPGNLTAFNTILGELSGVVTMSNVNILRLTDWLQKDLIPPVNSTVAENREHDKRRELIERDISDLDSKEERLKKIRNDLIGSVPFSKELTMLNESIEKMIVAMAALENDPDRERDVVKKRKLIVTYTNAIKSIKEKLSSLLAGHFQLASGISRLNSEIEATLRERVKLENNLRLHLVRVNQKSVKNKQPVNQIDIREQILNKMQKAREFVARGAVFSSREENAVMINPSLVFSVRELTRRLAMFEEYDRDLFQIMHEAKHGAPDILLIPFSGRGYYDYHNHLLITPTSGSSLEEAFLHMLAHYRLYKDKEGRMVDEYLKLDSRKGLIGSSKAVTEGFSEDYISWMGDNEERYEKIPPDVKDWFEEKFVPLEIGIQAPEYLVVSGQTVKEVNEVFTRCKRNAEDNPEDIDTQFELGIVFFYQKLYDRAIDQFEIVLQLDPGHKDSLYNKAVLLEKTGRKEKAIATWRQIRSTGKKTWLGRLADKRIERLK